MAYAEEIILNPEEEIIRTLEYGLVPDLNGKTSRTGALTCFCQ